MHQLCEFTVNVTLYWALKMCKIHLENILIRTITMLIWTRTVTLMMEQRYILNWKVLLILNADIQAHFFYFITRYEECGRGGRWLCTGLWLEQSLLRVTPESFPLTSGASLMRIQNNLNIMHVTCTQYTHNEFKHWANLLTKFYFHTLMKKFACNWSKHFSSLTNIQMQHYNYEISNKSICWRPIM